MCTRLQFCLACLASRDCLEQELRVNTLTSGLVCDECFSPEVVAVDMLGRAARLGGKNHVFCGACRAVRAPPFRSGRQHGTDEEAGRFTSTNPPATGPPVVACHRSQSRGPGSRFRVRCESL